MAQQRRSTHRKQKSDFPIFDYIDMMMPQKLLARFMEMPRHVRWTIISSIASLFLLVVFLRVVLGGINQWIESQGSFLYDSYYLPYDLTERPVPIYPETITEADRFVLLPDIIANQYVLQIPPTEEEVQAVRQAELDAFLALSLPVADSLTVLRETLGEQPGEPVVATEAEAVVDASEPVVTDDGDAVPTAVPTVDPIQIQVTALDGVLTPLVTLNEALGEADSIDLVYEAAAPLQQQLNMLEASGIGLPQGFEPFKQRIDELTLVEPTTTYQNNDCLMAALDPKFGKNHLTENPPCTITQRAMFVEQGEYVDQNGKTFNVVVAEFPRPVGAAWAVKQLFYRARFVGVTGNFAIDDIIEYNHFLSRADDVYSLAWTHDNWVYSISGASIADIDAMMKVFPF